VQATVLGALGNYHDQSACDCFNAWSCIFFILKNWNYSQWKTPSFLFPHPQPLATTILLSVSMNLITLDVSYTCNHSVFIILWLAYFIYHNVFKGHSCHLTYRTEFTSSLRLISIPLLSLHHVFSIHSLEGRYLGDSYLLECE
jgi:hypothetical protein